MTLLRDGTVLKDRQIIEPYGVLIGGSETSKKSMPHLTDGEESDSEDEEEVDHTMEHDNDNDELNDQPLVDEPASDAPDRVWKVYYAGFTEEYRNAIEEIIGEAYFVGADEVRKSMQI
eukprot:TRINITY_DN2489_c0_g1_i1.p1 TRINITY_DN2489_c0_g1~~TRINITY_DN2489_c0_g1_i1.p1  ORF type:complete len:118 (-),score=31.51 TRINITY_DN2489_c0_g1_i1:12-365(-)